MATESVATDKPADPAFLAAQDFEALFAKSDMAELEQCAKSFGVHRRVLQAILASGKDELLSRVEDPEKSADTFFKMLELATSYKEHLAGLVEQVETAEARIFCVLSTLCEKYGVDEGEKEVAQ